MSLSSSQRLTPAAVREMASARLGGPVRLFRAPGRVNLIGEHTDYNLGFVLPAAIDRYTYVAARPRAGRELRMASAQFPETFSLSLDQLKPLRGWGNYLAGVADGLQTQGLPLHAAELFVTSEVPYGAGLSSSAALEISTGLALASLSGASFDPLHLVRAGQHAEHAFAGTQSGVMDQFISTFARAGHALRLDCRNLEWELVALPAGCALVICNTGVKHELAGSEYNQRRQECETGVDLLRRDRPEIASLRDVTIAELTAHQADLPPVIFRRCRHIVTENQRVLDAGRAFHDGDFARLRRLFSASHASMRDDYEISCRELDLMVAAAEAAPGFLAGRMTGGGFGGCTVNLVRPELVEPFRSATAQAYAQATGREAEIIATPAAAGCEELL